ncbi:MAG: DUF3098 domain-containing protein [Cytophagales bacterium]|nr:MAG: DUF3098 domain-containing protein [Cytophagales bacterium]
MATKVIKNNIQGKAVANEQVKKTAVQANFAFTRDNYVLMLAGIGAILLGFFIMSLDSEPHGFGFLGLTLGPIIVMAGFLFEFFAIFYTKKTKSE